MPPPSWQGAQKEQERWRKSVGLSVKGRSSEDCQSLLIWGPTVPHPHSQWQETLPLSEKAGL